ncbi:hypothetical protein [Tahibacter sp.]|uniref:hypothetical protein n=1 Tax=Tahibacter sp. TaxID=2056211 RepID=UPI0028C40757|nr:hypothetical protein [Tahibacter sp.]
MRTTLVLAALLFGALSAAGSVTAAPLGTAFTYQGALENGGAAANGPYDLEFRLYDAAVGGSQVGVTQTVDDLAITDGVFTVPLDFGAPAFAGQARWLQIALRPGASADPYTVLDPRQAITAAPFALHAQGVPAGSISATEIDSASVQRRISGSCAVGTSIRVIASNGVVSCEVDDDGAAALAAHAANATAHGPLVWVTPNATDTYTSRDRVGLNIATPEATLHINDTGATGPALLMQNATASEGDIAVVQGEVMQIGAYNTATSTFTNYLNVDGTGDVGVAQRLGVGTLTPNTALVVQANDPVLQVRDDTTDNSANAARIQLLERSGGAFDGGAFLRWDGDLNRLNIGTLNNGAATNLLTLDRASQSVGIGTTTLDNSYALSVNGSIRAKEIVVESGWADFVFADDYRLAPLPEVAQFIELNGHLPDVPSAARIAESGVPLGEMQTRLLQKIEELTLHMIAMDRDLARLRADNAGLRERLTGAETRP